MFVAALNGADNSNPSAVPEIGNADGRSNARGFSMSRTARQLAIRAAQHWLKPPFPHGMERRAT